MKVLLHTCCGPCASACVPRLKDEGHEVTMFYANSNIDTEEEFKRRLAAASQLAAADGVGLVADEYDHAAWLRDVAAGLEDEPEKGARCAKCFRFNLARTAAYAAAHGYDAFVTSLTVSPHKVSPVIFAQGDAVSAKFLHYDFKKKEGFKLSVRRAQKLGLYRQSYCGCEFSKRAQEARMKGGPCP
ncbi:MAG: epoxyqueuosine reductase QueH [Kiritimatiellia bacterium]|nr:epoxyqueuosine reductase QueH [Kiritimatiellia bacterium]